MIRGLLPPNSKVTGIIFSAAFIFTLRPDFTEPVKVTLATSGWRTSASPVRSPSPVITFKTPLGRIAPSNCAARSTVKEASGDAFKTTVLPAARAGATFMASNIKGTFQGIIAPITPRGSRIVNARILGS